MSPPPLNFSSNGAKRSMWVSSASIFSSSRLACSSSSIGVRYTSVADETLEATTERLYQIKLALDLLGSALVCWFFLDIIYRGKLSYKVNWYVEQKRKRIKAMREDDRRLRVEVGRVLYEAQKVIENG